jgi:hypothetical protein
VVGPHGIYPAELGARRIYELISATDAPDDIAAAPDLTGIAVERWLDPLRLPPSSGRFQLLATDQVVATRALRFEGCWKIAVIGGAAWGAERWLCPGTGYVRTEFQSCYVWRTHQVIVTELVGWHLPPW